MAPETTRRCRTFRYRLHPTFRQTQALLHQLDYQRELYNAALEERVGAWKWERRSVSYVDQCRTLTGLREVRPEVLASGIPLCRGTLKRLDRAFAAFYRRVKLGATPGFPRFKSARRFNSLEWEDASGWKVKAEDRRLYLLGIGDVKANYHRPLMGVPKAITVKREGTKWWVSVRCVDVSAAPLPPTGREVGVDLGIANFVATSDGELIVGEHFGSRARSQLAAAQRRLATRQRGSNRRRRQVDVVAQLHRKVANQRKNAAHQLSRRLVNDYDLIAVEDLAITNMVRAPKAKPDPDQRGAEGMPQGVRVAGGHGGLPAVAAEDGAQPGCRERLAPVRALRHDEQRPAGGAGPPGEQAGLDQGGDVRAGRDPALPAALAHHLDPAAGDVHVGDGQAGHLRRGSRTRSPERRCGRARRASSPLLSPAAARRAPARQGTGSGASGSRIAWQPDRPQIAASLRLMPAGAQPALRPSRIEYTLPPGRPGSGT